MSRLWYWQKFAVLTVLFTIPVAFALSSFILQINKNIASTKKEILGLEYVSPVLSLLQHMQRHRAMAIIYKRSDPPVQISLDEKELEIREDIARVDAADLKSGTAFQSSGRWNGIKGKWFVLQAEYRGLAPGENFTRHTELISDILALIHTIGDNSDLVLDPELPSYETMNAIINILPALTENLGQARSFGLRVKDPDKISDEESRAFINYVKIAGIENAKLQDEMRDAFESAPSVKTDLEGPLGEADGAVKNFAIVADEIVNSKKMPMSLPEYYAFMTRVTDVHFSLSSRLVSILDGLLESRIAALDRKFKMSVGVTAASYILILYFFAGFYFLVSRTVREFENIAKRLAGGEAEGFPDLSGDELGKVGESFNIIGRALIASNSENLGKANEIQKRVRELEQMNKFMIDREVKMVELKEELRAIKSESGNPKKISVG